jgi:hypothetical protein
MQTQSRPCTNANLRAITILVNRKSVRHFQPRLITKRTVYLTLQILVFARHFDKNGSEVSGSDCGKFRGLEFVSVAG